MTDFGQYRSDQVVFDTFNKLTNNKHLSIVVSGEAEGENRVQNAIENALNSSPFLRDNLPKANKVNLLLMYSPENELKMSELPQNFNFINFAGNFEWSSCYDHSLKNTAKAVFLVEFEKGISL